MKRLDLIMLLVFLLGSVAAFSQETQPQQGTQEAQQPPAMQTEKPLAAWSKTVELKEEDTLTIYADPGNIRFVPADQKLISFTVEGLDAAGQARIQVTSKNKNVRLDYRGDKSVEGTFVIKLPSKFNIDSYSSGNVEVQGNLNGTIKLKTNQGSIILNDVAGNLFIDSSEGDISVGNVQGNASLTTNADIETQDIAGDLDLKNQSGDSFVKSVTGNVNATVADGDLAVGEVGGNATASSTIGDIEFRKVTGMSTINSESGDIDFFEGPSMIIANSNSGDITLRKVSGAIDAKSEDGDISAELFAGSGGSSKMYTREGDLEVFFPDDARATVEAKVSGQGIDEDDEPIISDWKPAQGGTALSGKYEIGGGGDSVLMETVNGEILIKKLAQKTAATPNQ
jgi:hypothetical protein